MTTRKPTRQQVAVSDMLAELDDFTSAQELHARLRSEGNSVGLATVYRALQNMANDGTVDVLRTGDGEAVYRRCSDSHHHHIVCRHCGKTVEVEGPAVEKWAATVSKQHGFTDVAHQVEIFGTCAECAAKPSAESV